ncbi:hypothetical protein HK103_004803 [Boothiomyces macroporosus]|uniref:Uncharacterized protein n=1 Tax=Boothiomyces macroporosus TaxID=261099 RepID=A0AAD5Y5M8_9FUNG|nr:hypothetical protein HK103_004803 [Boothiomyces macroporosus]
MNNFLSNFFNSLTNNQQANQDSNQPNEQNENSHHPEQPIPTATTTTTHVPGGFPVAVRVNHRRVNLAPNEDTPQTITFSANDRLAKLILLSNLLPTELAEMVLDFAQVFKTVKFERKAMYQGANCDERYLITKPFNFKKIHRIRFRGESKDQGWATMNPELNGTRQDSWTWAEVYVDSAEHVERNVAYAGDRTRVYTNLRAGSGYEEHDIDLDIDLKRGQVLVLVIRAQFPGWKHIIKHASMEFSFTD